MDAGSVAPTIFLPFEGVKDPGSGKGDPGLELALRISSLIGRLLRRGATSYRVYRGVEVVKLMLDALFIENLTGGLEGPAAFSYSARDE